jgi:Yip1 domain
MRTAAANFSRIMIKPRETLRRILDAGRDRMLIPLVALAAISGFVGDFDRASIDMLRGGRFPPALVIATLILASIAIALIVFYIVSWAVYGIGKLLEGTGTPSDIRSALAWGLAPLIWALLYRLPIVFFGPRVAMQMGSERFRIDPGLFRSGCLLGVVFGIIELGMLAWCVAVTSNTIGEAHRFSSWRGLATIVLVGISPAIIVAAAVLAM